MTQSITLLILNSEVKLTELKCQLSVQEVSQHTWRLIQIDNSWTKFKCLTSLPENVKMYLHLYLFLYLEEKYTYMILNQYDDYFSKFKLNEFSLV